MKSVDWFWLYFDLVDSLILNSVVDDFLLNSCSFSIGAETIDYFFGDKAFSYGLCGAFPERGH